MEDKLLDQTKSKELTEKPSFTPTPHMIVWLDTAIRLMTDNISEIERESKVTAQAWYNWLKVPGFIEWYKTAWDKMLASHGPTLDVIGFKNAKRDFKYWEKMQQRVGNLKDDSQGKGVYIQQNFTEHAKNELKEFE